MTTHTLCQSALTYSFDHPRGLLGFWEGPCNLALWKRPVPSESTSFLAQVAVYPVCFRACLAVAEIESRLRAHLESVIPKELSSVPFYENWLRDILMLCEAYAEDHALSELDFQLDTERSCVRFHADTVTMRLLCVYSGPGTEWLEEENFDRQVAETRGTTNEQFVREPSRIRRFHPWEVAVMKGKLGSSVPLFHRSPPMTPDEPPSLLLKVDKPGSIPNTRRPRIDPKQHQGDPHALSR